MDTRSIKFMRLFFIGLLLWLAGCQHESEPIVLDEQPRILSMSLQGVPPENITIDQQTHTITVLLPSTLPALEMVPSFTVSQQASVYSDWGTGQKAVSLAYYCPGTYDEQGRAGTFKPIEPVRVDNLTRTSYYTIQLKSKGEPLRIKPLQTPIIYDLTGISRIIVPVENYYGSSFVEYIAVTKTGSLSPFWIGPGGGSLADCVGLLNAMSIPLAGYSGTGALKPGLHDLDLWLADGTKVHAEGYILVK